MPGTREAGTTCRSVHTCTVSEPMQEGQAHLASHSAHRPERVGNGERTGAKSNLHPGERLKGKRGSGIPPKACLSLSRNCQASPVFKGPLTPPPALWGHWKALLLASDCDQAPPQESRAACQGADNWPLVTCHKYSHMGTGRQQRACMLRLGSRGIWQSCRVLSSSRRKRQVQ